MGRESEDKAARILSIYSRLKQGKIISKQEESLEYHVAERTIQRDIADIQCYLQNQANETGEVQEVVYEKSLGGYVLHEKNKVRLEGKEVLAIVKVLLESRSLMKSEMFPIITKLLGMCGNGREKKMLEEFVKNEIYHYVELKHGKTLLDKLWDLEQAVKGKQYIEIRYQKLKNQEVVTRKLKPVGIMFSEFYYYLVAFIDDIDKTEQFQNPDDTFPTIYRVDRIVHYKVLTETFRIPYADRFEEGEFKKRVQFMYGGKLRKIRFKYTGNSLDSVLDRLPTAEVVRKEKDGTIVQAEVFGDGIEMWMRSQGEYVEALKREM